jgi:hypothetical protein
VFARGHYNCIHRVEPLDARRAVVRRTVDCNQHGDTCSRRIAQLTRSTRVVSSTVPSTTRPQTSVSAESTMRVGISRWRATETSWCETPIALGDRRVEVAHLHAAQLQRHAGSELGLHRSDVYGDDEIGEQLL